MVDFRQSILVFLGVESQSLDTLVGSGKGCQCPPPRSGVCFLLPDLEELVLRQFTKPSESGSESGSGLRGLQGAQWKLSCPSWRSGLKPGALKVASDRCWHSLKSILLLLGRVSVMVPAGVSPLLHGQ